MDFGARKEKASRESRPDDFSTCAQLLKAVSPVGRSARFGETETFDELPGMPAGCPQLITQDTRDPGLDSRVRDCLQHFAQLGPPSKCGVTAPSALPATAIRKPKIRSRLFMWSRV